MTCDVCASPTVFCISPGRDGLRHPLLGQITRSVADRTWCEPCAVAAGWPWLSSERAKRGAQ